MIPRAKKFLGQHFLFDKNILEKMIHLGGIVPELPVLEIGPGPGELTATLLAHGCYVSAVEFDRDMIAELKRRFAVEIAAQQLELIYSDILKQDFGKLLAGNKPRQVVGNIPYNISTEIIFKFIESRTRAECGMFLVQKEVAERISAGPGSKTYGVLSIAVQLATYPRVLFHVGRKSFVPPPKVDSSIIYMGCGVASDRCPGRVPDPRILSGTGPESPSGAGSPVQAPFPLEVYAPTMALVKTAFQQRRKTLKNALRRAGWAPSIIDARLRELGLSPTARPETLSPAQWVQLSTSAPYIKRIP